MSVTTYPKSLALKHDLRSAWIVSGIVAVLMAGLSLAGLLIPEWLYPLDDLIRQSYRTNDLINLLLGLPILLLPMWFTRRGNFFALLCWPGALLYNLYNYTAYVFGLPFSLSTVFYAAIALLSIYGVYDLLSSVDGNAILVQMEGVVPRRLGSVLLMLFAVGFILRSLGLLFQFAMGQQDLSMADIGVLVADLLLSAFAVGSGILLLRRHPLGYASSVGLLFAISMLFFGLLLLFIVQPLLTDTPFLLGDFLVVALMTVVWIIPAGIYLRRAWCSNR